MIEAVMLWNEPNNKSHWDFEIDADWSLFAEMTRRASERVRRENPALTQVLGGMSPIDACFLSSLQGRCLEGLDVVAVHGFPLDWNHWQLDDWPERLREVQAVTHLPVWVTEVGVSSFGAEEVQELGLLRTLELLRGKAERIHWYSLLDLPRAWPATTRHREAEGSAYYRHFYMGLFTEDGRPKKAAQHFHRYTPEIGVVQWFHFEDPRLDDAVLKLQELGVRHLRTGLSWADWYRPGWQDWFDRQMQALEPFDVTVTFCFTPEHRGMAPHYTSPPVDLDEFGEFCAQMVRRYAPASPRAAVEEPAGASLASG